MISWVFIIISIILFILWIIVEIRDIRKKQFLAALMDCEYVQIGFGEYYFSKKKGTK
jgi:hypothetical protein